MDDGAQRCAVLYPAIAEAAHRTGATTVGLVDVGPPGGPNLQVDRVGITYSDGRVLGDPAAAVQVSARLVGRVPVPAREVPEVVARVEVTGTLTDALAQVPAGALPVVTTTWTLARFTREDRLRFLQLLDAAATHRTVAWVSVEGVGVAPAVPTFGDRHASGHSTTGLALFRHGTLHAEALGRCWSRGRALSWLASASEGRA
ncbi:DUF2332 family protein [Kineococcus sp. SYSU DK003]|uniref:DUF2332 family protein n=1 Tax=Kineococcus sp. SYSU DK003 TaxID=3383124 RepID=UPI003D7E2440